MKNKSFKIWLKTIITLLFINQLYQLQGQNYAAYFEGNIEGTLNNITIPALNTTNLPITIEAWFKPVGNQNDYASILFSRNGSSTPTGIFIRPTINNEIRSIWSNDLSTTSTNLIVKNDVWHHVALVVTSSYRYLYLDGQLFDYMSTNNKIENFDTNIKIGWDDALPNRTFKGYIDEVRIWNEAKSLAQIEQNKYVTLSGTENNLLGYWKFDDQAITATDYTTNQHNGIINGASYKPSDVFAPMTYLKSNVWQPLNEISVHNKTSTISRIEIETQNTAQALLLKKLTINCNGTSNLADINSIKVYYTGKDTTFSTQNLFCEFSGTKTGLIELNGTTKLESGKNFFYISYEISNNALNGNTLDAECVSFIIEGAESKFITLYRLVSVKMMEQFIWHLIIMEIFCIIEFLKKVLPILQSQKIGMLLFSEI
ncbi:MAG: hypothetical protein IPO21_21120 [Bacteroidales bacterium]|nr:hypothetical protein [Bacteroidales bacterium]